MNITQNETDLMIAIRDSEYNDQTGTCFVWVNMIHDWAGTKKFSGVASSLTKKGLIVSSAQNDDAVIRLTDKAMTLIGPGNGESVLTKKRKAAKASAIETETKTAILHHDPKTVSEPKLQIEMTTKDFVALHDFVAKSESPAAQAMQTMLDQILLDLLRNSIKA